MTSARNDSNKSVGISPVISNSEPSISFIVVVIIFLWFLLLKLRHQSNLFWSFWQMSLALRFLEHTYFLARKLFTLAVFTAPRDSKNLRARSSDKTQSTHIFLMKNCSLSAPPRFRGHPQMARLALLKNAEHTYFLVLWITSESANSKMQKKIGRTVLPIFLIFLDT